MTETKTDEPVAPQVELSDDDLDAAAGGQAAGKADAKGISDGTSNTILVGEIRH